MSFLSRTLDWFQGRRSAHMGPDQYVAHGGERDGQSMSGALLWAASEAKTLSALGNMVNAETKLLQRVVAEIREFVPDGVAVIDLGPGTLTAFKNKTLPIVTALNSDVCALVDDSAAFLQAITEADGIGGMLKLKPVVDDFFEIENAYLDQDALVCSFGSTVSNFPGTLSDELPRAVLRDGLAKMANAAKNGWLLVAFDSDHDEERIKSYYQGQEEFQLNIFYRMAAELPFDGAFDPKMFRYTPRWIASSGQLAHIAVADCDMDFELSGTRIRLKKGQEFHIKNSYKFKPAFFETCCRAAGLEIVKAWSDDSPAKVYLLRIVPGSAGLDTTDTVNAGTEEEIRVA